MQGILQLERYTIAAWTAEFWQQERSARASDDVLFFCEAPKFIRFTVKVK